MSIGIFGSCFRRMVTGHRQPHDHYRFERSVKEQKEAERGRSFGRVKRLPHKFVILIRLTFSFAISRILRLPPSLSTVPPSLPPPPAFVKAAILRSPARFQDSRRVSSSGCCCCCCCWLLLSSADHAKRSVSG